MKSIGKEFMEKTKYKYLEASDQSIGIPQPPLQIDYDPEKPIIDLPSPRDLNYGTEPLIDIINRRRSIRKYSDLPLSKKELSFLLWCMQGVQKTRMGAATLRTVPSAGARHAFETYILINKVDGLDRAIYRYLALEHKLVLIDTSNDISENVIAGCLGQGFAASSAVTFIWVADVNRMKWRYSERSYRYLHLDAGHVCHSLYLAAESIGCGVCAIAAFDDDSINETLGLDGEDQFVIYIASAGKKVTI